MRRLGVTMTAGAKLSPRRSGLTAAEVASARQSYGWNALPQPPRVSWVVVLLRQFAGLLVLMLIGAALIALLLGERIDALAIGLVVLLNGVLGFVQEWRAETALEALRNMLSPTALVVRDGHEQHVPSRELVPGDLVIVSAGSSVPADMTLCATVDLSVD
ncbi:MAG: cation-transporting P-type ATPase, partial [Pseudomonadota bacterium]